MLKAKTKKTVIGKTQIHERDTGSTEVQVGLITQQIKELTAHLKNHPKDNHSRRGLLKMVAKRKKLLTYLSRLNPEGHETLVKKLGLRK